MKTRQAVLVNIGRFEIHETEIAPAAGELLIKIHACGLCKWELNFWKGHLGTCPQTLGHEMTGVVIEAGKNVTRFKVGDAVTGFANGLVGFADYCIASEEKIFRLSPAVDIKGALGEPLSCVITTLSGAAPATGDTGVIVGCGPMGLWCIQALSGGMLSGLVAVDVCEKKLALARRYGATHTLNSKTQDVSALLREITDGHLADFVIDGTGVPAVFNQLHAYLKTGRGRLVMMSSHEAVCKEFDWRPLQSKGASIHITHPSFAADTVESLRRAVALYNRGIFQMDGIITHEYPLAKIQEAFEALENPPAGYNKGIVVP